MSSPPQPGPILDYASPRRRQKVRLPSRSRIVAREEHGEFAIREWLQAKESAYVALAVAGLSLASLAYGMLTECFPFGWKGHFWRSPLFGEFVILATFSIVEVSVMLLVIRDTWRETTLLGRSEGLLLRLSSPFSRQQFEWNADDIEQIRLVLSSKVSDSNPLAEIEIHVAGKPVAKLFTDHYLKELKPIAAGLLRAIGRTESVDRVIA